MTVQEGLFLMKVAKQYSIQWKYPRWFDLEVGKLLERDRQ
jgi:hypothetical protein